MTDIEATYGGSMPRCAASGLRCYDCGHRPLATCGQVVGHASTDVGGYQDYDVEIICHKPARHRNGICDSCFEGLIKCGFNREEAEEHYPLR